MKVARALVVGAAVVSGALSTAGCRPHVLRCQVDEGIAASKLKVIHLAAKSFVQKAIGPDPGSAYEHLSSELKSTLTPEQFRNRMAGLLRETGPLTRLFVQRTYFAEVMGAPPRRMMCGIDLPDSERAFLALADAREQAHVILLARAGTDRIAFTVWLLHTGDAWQVRSLWMNQATLGQKNAAELRALARSEHANGHDFNAAVLYAGAQHTAYRGPNLDLAVSQSIAEEMSKLKLPPEIAGKPPFSWTEGPMTLEVQLVGALSVAGKLHLRVAHEVAPGLAREQLEHANQQVIQYVKRRFPECSEVFAGLDVRALEPGTGRSHGSVEELPGAD
jgi:hypothetical protein